MTVRVVGLDGHPDALRADAAAAMDDVERAAEGPRPRRAHAATAQAASLLEARGYVVDRDLLVAMEGALRVPPPRARSSTSTSSSSGCEFCHTIELDGRWERHATTIPIEDLLLQKLQVARAAPART